ncbi:hypothetical protein [Pseudomonas aeruginosa]|uniref:hypothetical protein n=1 Tax=Pseudomonas aeruginosa TaxID=287 RepID=UPI002E18B436|nr:hypothetical protein [Pseudomonas aeruginosa]
MSSTQHQLIEQCAIRLRGIVEALDNIHDSTQHRSPHRWSTDLDDVHSSAESLLALIKDQAPTQAAQGLAGAALAQPSPLQAEQAEAEGPEMSPERAAYFMRRFKSEEKLLGPNEQAAVDYVLSLLAQHDRIVGALRADNERLRQGMKGDYDIDAWLEWAKEKDRIVGALRRQVSVLALGAEQAMEQRATALSRVAELEKKLSESEKRGSELAASYCDGVVGDEYGHAYCRYKSERDAALAEIAELEKKLAMALDAASKGDAARHAACGMEMEIQELKAKLAEIAGDFLPDNSGQAELALNEMRQALHELLATLPPAGEFIGRLSEFLAQLGATGKALLQELRAMLAAAPTQAQHSVPKAWLDVQAERRRQVEAEGWTPEHDDEHSHGQMARAAACYALAGSSAPNDGTAALLVSLAWPWDQQWWKPTSARRDLVKACALALAEIERLDRACISQSPQPGATTASS